MPLFNIYCQKCKKVTRVLRKERPKLGQCECGGINTFAINVSTQVMERLDNGIMPKAVERLSNIEELKKERIELAEKPDSDIV